MNRNHTDSTAAVPAARLFGQDETGLVERGGAYVHRDIVESLDRLCRDAAGAGFQLDVASGYRSFERQLLIWNEKADGTRPLLDDCGQIIDRDELDETGLLFAILRWSALPGASRHHWGTDIDIYDSAAVGENYRVQLTEVEVNTGGPFAAMHDWLDQAIGTGNAYGFFRPYTGDRGGLAAERWHLSHGPASALFERSLAMDRLYRFIENEPRLLLRQTVLANFDRLFNEYVAIYNGLAGKAAS